MVRAGTLAMALILAAGCATPSRSEIREQNETTKAMMRAEAVHMPPKGVDSCIGVTVRLTDPSMGDEAQREELAGRITDAEAQAALAEAGIERCEEAYLRGIEDAGITPEPLALRAAYGVDPAGRVCAVVERARPDPIDPAAVPLIDAAAECLKTTLFSARFPAGRVEDKERVVRFHTLSVNPVAGGPATETFTSTVGEG